MFEDVLQNFLNHIVLFNIIWSIFSIYVPSSFRSSPTIYSKYDCVSQSFLSLSCNHFLSSDPLLLTTSRPLYTKFQCQEFLLTLANASYSALFKICGLAILFAYLSPFLESERVMLVFSIFLSCNTTEKQNIEIYLKYYLYLPFIQNVKLGLPKEIRFVLDKFSFYI